MVFWLYGISEFTFNIHEYIAYLEIVSWAFRFPVPVIDNFHARYTEIEMYI